MGQQLLVVALGAVGYGRQEPAVLHFFRRLGAASSTFLTLSALQGVSRSKYVCPVPISGGPEGGPSHPGKETDSIRLESFMVTLGINPSN